MCALLSHGVDGVDGMKTALALQYVCLTLRETLFLFSEPFQYEGNLASRMEIRDLEAGTVHDSWSQSWADCSNPQVPEQTLLP